MTDFRQFPLVNIGQIIDPAVRVLLSLAMSGKLNIVEEVTLTPGAATTDLDDDLITEGSFLGLMPMSANAAAALATTYFSAPVRGQVTIHHANSAQVDRTFRYVCLG